MNDTCLRKTCLKNTCRHTCGYLAGFLVVFFFGASTWGAEDVPSAAVFQAEQSRIDVMRRVADSVVAVFGAEGKGGGSGVLVSPDGYVLTNFHVVHGAGPFLKCGLNDGVLYDAVIVGIDPTGDVAVIKLAGRNNFPVATPGDSDRVQVGDQVFAMGNPFLLATDFHPTATFGIVSGTHRYQYPAGTILEYTDCLQIDASINPGNSGGPLFNLHGELIGINGRASFEKRGRVNVGAAYAISINQIRNFQDALQAGRLVDHATLGATVTTDSRGLVVVSAIRENSDAYRKGLRLDDEIVTFAGRPVGSVNQFKNILGIYPSGRRVGLTYRREGVKQEIFIRLQNLHSPAELVDILKGGAQETPPETPPRQADPQNPERSRPEAVEAKSTPVVPDELKRQYEYRSGYINFYFNRLRRDPLLKSIADWKRSESISGLWTLTGKTEQGISLTIKINNVGAGLILGADQFYQDYSPGAERKDEPPGTGGLLAALQHLRLLLTEGETAFTECSYWGSEPLEDGSEVVDIVRCELAGATSLWYFRRTGGVCLGFRYQLQDDSGWCDLHWDQLGTFAGLDFPSRMFLRGSQGSEWVLDLEEVQITPTPPASQTSPSPPLLPGNGGNQSD